MKYEVEFKPKSLKDCKKIPKSELKRIFDNIEEMSYDLKGDVRPLSNFSPEYRLRIGDYRVLFEVEQNKITIYRIRHRKDAYK